MFKGTVLPKWRLEWIDREGDELFGDAKEERVFLSFEALCDFAASLPDTCTKLQHFKEA